MPPIVRRSTTVITVVFILLSASCSLTAASQLLRVLFISSYHPHFPSFSDQVSGLTSVLSSDKYHVDIEFMDTKRFNDPQNWKNFDTLLTYKLENTAPYDLIITGDDNALHFAVNKQAGLFQDIPIVFFGVNDLDFALQQNQNPWVTGVVEAVSMKETVDLMIKLCPAASTIVAISDTTPSGKGDLTTFRTVAQGYTQPAFKVISLEEHSWESFHDELSELDENHAVLLLSAYRDKYGKTYTFTDSLEQITERLSSPIFHLWKHGVGNGLLGGKIISHFQQGQSAAAMAMEILQGRSVADMQIQNNSPNRYYFDYNQLTRFNIDRSVLPADSSILNQPVSFFRENKWLILGLGGVIAVLLVFLSIAVAHILYRKKSEARLRASKERFRTFIEKIPDPFFAHDADGAFIQVNEKACSVLGYPREELLKKKVMDIETGMDGENAREIWEKAASGESVKFESLHRRKDGSTIPVEVNIAALRGEEGVWFIGMSRDLTQREEAERELKKLAYDLMAILDNIHAYIYFKDTENNIIRVSEAVAKTTGLPKHRIEGRHSSEIYPEMADKYWADDLEVIQTGKPKLGIVESLPVKNGRERWLLTDKVPYFDAHGQVAGVIVMAIDITDRVNTEILLRESEVKFKSLFEYAADALYLVSEEGQILEVNKAAEVQTGYSNEELLKMNVGNLDPRSVADDDRSRIWRKLKPGDSFVLTTTHLRKDGSTFPVEVHVSTIELSNKKLILGFARDLSERREFERRLQQAQKMESIGNLAGGIAHDFNNILSSILGFTELALEEVEKGSPLEDDLQEVFSAGKRARDLVKQILAFARQSEEKKSPIKPGNIAREVVKFIRSTIPTTIEIRQNVECNSWIIGNATQVHQVLLNLCTNAAHSMEDSGGVLEMNVRDLEGNRHDVKVELEQGQYVEIEVSDTGQGIAPDVIDSIFEPYFTTKGPGEGTGLGLAMVQGVIESYGGKITVESELGKGTTFVMYLPATEKYAAHDAYTPEELPQGTERILFIDDEYPLLKMGGQILERLGYSVTTCNRSIEALELFRTRPDDFDLVITDMTMPKMAGDELTFELLKIRQDIPVILCTGYNKNISDEMASAIGIKAFVYKPIIKADLAKTIRKVLDEDMGTAHIFA